MRCPTHSTGVSTSSQTVFQNKWSTLAIWLKWKKLIQFPDWKVRVLHSPRWHWKLDSAQGGRREGSTRPVCERPHLSIPGRGSRLAPSHMLSFSPQERRGASERQSALLLSVGEPHCTRRMTSPSFAGIRDYMLGAANTSTSGSSWILFYVIYFMYKWVSSWWELWPRRSEGNKHKPFSSMQIPGIHLQVLGLVPFTLCTTSQVQVSLNIIHVYGYLDMALDLWKGYYQC